MVTPNFFQAARNARGLMRNSSPAATSPGELEAEDTAAGDRWARRPGRDQDAVRSDAHPKLGEGGLIAMAKKAKKTAKKAAKKR